MYLSKMSSNLTRPARSLLQRMRTLWLLKCFPVRNNILRWSAINYWFLIASLPVALFGIWRIGYQMQGLFSVIEATRVAAHDWPISLTWQFQWFSSLNLSDPAISSASFSPLILLAQISLGLLFFIPLLIICYAACRFWDWFFIRYLNRIPDGGNLLISFLFVLLIPLTMPVGYAVLGISFGIVFGKLIFGGSGRYLVSPVLVGVLFLHYSYPDLFKQMSNSFALAGLPSADSWQLLADQGVANFLKNDIGWGQAFAGGYSSVSEISSASALLSLFGLIILVNFHKTIWRLPLGAIVGLIVATLVLNTAEKSAVWQINWYWHLIAGNFIFCLAFIATDPTVLPMTRMGVFLYGASFSFITIIIRVTNPDHPQGTLMALLLTSLLVPLIDWLVIESQRQLSRRKRGYSK